VDNFSDKFLSVYKYEVLGGQHTALAKQRLHQQNSSNPLFREVLAEVYVGLTTDKSLTLRSI
jgi:hypothetical protein